MSVVEAVKNAVDVFKLGRVVFYGAAGIPVAAPIAMAAQQLMVETPPSAKSDGSFHRDAVTAASSTLSAPSFYVFALVTGFLLAVAAYSLVLAPESRRSPPGPPNPSEHQYSALYNYPLLKNFKDDTDYWEFLIVEYYRWVELATFVPLGLLLGILVFPVYPAAWLVSFNGDLTAEALRAPYSALLGAPVLFLVAFAFGWSRWWLPKVVRPTIEHYQHMKQLLILRLRLHREEQEKRAESS